MKKINEDLLKLKIFIDSSSDSNFQEIALFIDNPEFLRLLPKLREDFEIDKLIPASEFEKKVFDEPYDIKKQKKINLSKYKNPKYLKSFAKEHMSQYSIDLDEEMDYCQFLDTETSLVCLQFQRPPYFIPIIKQAIFCGLVNDLYFDPTSIEIIENDIVESTTACFALPRAAISISPTTTYEKVKEAFREAQKLYKTDKRLSYYKPRLDFVNNIREYREWFWERREEKTYQKIADDYVESKLPAQYSTTYQDVIKGVKIYEKLLAS